MDRGIEGGGLSRRRFLIKVSGVAAAAWLHLITGCSRLQTTSTDETQLHDDGPESTDTSVLTPTRVQARVPTSTPSPTPAATEIPDEPRFDEATLTPVYAAHDPAITSYPSTPPYEPDTAYPELPYVAQGTGSRNDAYRLVRESLRLFHPDGFGSEAWNPLKDVIRPGDRVLIKPNLVHDAQWERGQTTHPALLRPVIDYVYKACGRDGRIIVGDAPWSVDVFERLVRMTGLRETIDVLKEDYGLPVVLQDLNQCDAQNTPLVDLGSYSQLHGVQRTWYDGHGQPLVEGGDPGIGTYRVAPAVLEADVVISLPKAKVHCSGGITVAMKNMVGIIPAWDGPHGDGALKDCAHTSDVDQAAGKRGMYLENDTIWRTMADLNRIVLYADRDGVLQPVRRRRYLAIVDAIVAAEDSQYDPIPHPLGAVLIGTDPVSVDAATARCMGFDARALKSVVKAAELTSMRLGLGSPAYLKVETSDGRPLNDHFQRALVPERHIYSWQGVLEATDFAAPEVLDGAWDASSQRLSATLRDVAGVSWARISYEYRGEIRMKALELVSGTGQDGVWSVAFPLGAVVRDGELTAGDALFNETTEVMSW